MIENAYVESEGRVEILKYGTGKKANPQILLTSKTARKICQLSNMEIINNTYGIYLFFESQTWM